MARQAHRDFFSAGLGGGVRGHARSSAASTVACATRHKRWKESRAQAHLRPSDAPPNVHLRVRGDRRPLRMHPTTTTSTTSTTSGLYTSISTHRRRRRKPYERAAHASPCIPCTFQGSGGMDRSRWCCCWQQGRAMAMAIAVLAGGRRALWAEQPARGGDEGDGIVRPRVQPHRHRGQHHSHPEQPRRDKVEEHHRPSARDEQRQARRKRLEDVAGNLDDDGDEQRTRDLRTRAHSIRGAWACV